MLELFQSIAADPLGWLAGLGISSATIYTVIQIIIGFVKLVTKKSRKAKERLQELRNQELAEKTALNMANHLASSVVFAHNVADAVISKYKTENLNNCPTELQAYIQAVLTQNGSEGLALTYEQNMAKRLNRVKSEPIKATDALTPAVTITTEVNKNIKNPKSYGENLKSQSSKKKHAKDGDIVYDG